MLAVWRGENGGGRWAQGGRISYLPPNSVAQVLLLQTEVSLNFVEFVDPVAKKNLKAKEKFGVPKGHSVHQKLAEKTPAHTANMAVARKARAG